MNYLVLGSSGQIGQPCVDFLRASGHHVTEFDLVRSPSEDLRHPSNPLLLDALHEADYVIFLAWDVGGARYLKEHQGSYDFLMNNSKIVANTFDALKTSGKPFLFASSQMASMEFSPYGITKSLGELLTTAIGGRVVKFWNVYGLENDPARSHVITDFARQAKTTRVIKMLTDGSEVRQFLHAEDCAKAIHVISQNHDTIPPDAPLHVTSFKWTSILEVANTVQGLVPECAVIPADVTDSVQRGVQNEPNPFILEFWGPQIDLPTGIAKIVEAS